MNIKEKYGIDKNILLKILSIFLFLIVAVILECAMSFSIDVLKDGKFYLHILINYAVMIFTYNVIRSVVSDSKRHNEKSAYFAEARKNGMFLTYIRNNKLEPLISEKVKEANLRAKEEAEELALRKVTLLISLDEVKTMDDTQLAIFFEKVKTLKVHPRKLRKVIDKIRHNKIKYNHFTIRDILNDSESSGISVSNNQIAGNYAKFNFMQEASKTFKFMFTSIISSIIIFDSFNGNLIFELSKYVFLILTSTASGITAGNQYIAYRKAILTNRNIFLNQCVDLETSKKD